MSEINLKNIERFMTENSISEVLMAKRMGITYSYLYRVMRGTRGPGGKFIEGLVKAGMDAEQFFLKYPLPKGKTGTD